MRFGNRLFSGISTSPDNSDFATLLDKQYSSMLPSAPLSKFEHYEKLSDIVREGNGTCAAKTILLGVLLSRKYPGIQVQEIYGQTGIVRDRVSYPFGHVWLRAESNTFVFLYDAMYSRTACFEKVDGALSPTDNRFETFRNYSVEALPISALYNKLRFSGMRVPLKIEQLGRVMATLDIFL